MRITSVKAHGFKSLDDVRLDIDGKNTILFGVNGSGKSTVLSVIDYVAYIWLNRLSARQGAAYKTIEDEAIRFGREEAILTVELELNGRQWTLHRGKKRPADGYRSKSSYPTKEFSEFTDYFRRTYFDGGGDETMPIFVNYGTNRIVSDTFPPAGKNVDSRASAFDYAVEGTVDFKRFFMWFRNQEDLENEKRLNDGNPSYRDPLLSAVRDAIEGALGNLHNLRVRRDELAMTVEKQGQTIYVDQLSDGEKCTLALIGDIARRMALANPRSSQPLKGDGIVLIDEVELHLHPSWQRRILSELSRIFPNVQLVVTTHSPQVLGEVDDSWFIALLDSSDGACEVKCLDRMDRFDSNTILEDFMGTPSQNEEFTGLARKINRLISEGSLDAAEAEIETLSVMSGENSPLVIAARGSLQRKKWLNDQDR